MNIWNKKYVFLCKKTNRHAGNRNPSHLKRSSGQTALSGRDSCFQTAFREAMSGPLQVAGRAPPGHLNPSARGTSGPLQVAGREHHGHLNPSARGPQLTPAQSAWPRP